MAFRNGNRSPWAEYTVQNECVLHSPKLSRLALCFGLMLTFVSGLTTAAQEITQQQQEQRDRYVDAVVIRRSQSRAYSRPPTIQAPDSFGEPDGGTLPTASPYSWM